MCCCQCCTTFFSLILQLVHFACLSVGYVALGYSLDKSRDAVFASAAIVVVGLLGTFATSGRRPFLLLLHILVSFCVAVALTVLGILLLADAQIIIKRLPTESAEAVYLTENFKPVGYITLIMAGGYFVLAFLSWGYRNQLSAFSQDLELDEEASEGLLAGDDAASRASGSRPTSTASKTPKTDAARERLGAKFGNNAFTRRDKDIELLENQPHVSTSSTGSQYGHSHGRSASPFDTLSVLSGSSGGVGRRDQGVVFDF